MVQKRFKFPENTVELYAEKVANRGLCAIAQAESLRYKLLGGLAVRRCVCLFLPLSAVANTMAFWHSTRIPDHAIHELSLFMHSTSSQHGCCHQLRRQVSRRPWLFVSA